MTDDYARRKVQIIKEFLEAHFPAPYVVETVLPRRDPLADTRYKVILNNVVERTLLVCPAVVMDSFPTPDLLKEVLVSRKIIDKVNASTDSRARPRSLSALPIASQPSANSGRSAVACW